jgi:hypothetical protein
MLVVMGVLAYLAVGYLERPFHLRMGEEGLEDQGHRALSLALMA